MTAITPNYVYQQLSADQVRQLKGVEGNSVGSGILPQLLDIALTQLQASQAATVAAIGAYSNATIANPAAASQGVSYVQASINSALDAKADQTAVSTMLGSLNTKISATYTKLDAILTSLKAAGIMASA